MMVAHQRVWSLSPKDRRELGADSSGALLCPALQTQAADKLEPLAALGDGGLAPGKCRGALWAAAGGRGQTVRGQEG